MDHQERLSPAPNLRTSWQGFSGQKPNQAITPPPWCHTCHGQQWASVWHWHITLVVLQPPSSPTSPIITTTTHYTARTTTRTTTTTTTKTKTEADDEDEDDKGRCGHDMAQRGRKRGWRRAVGAGQRQGIALGRVSGQLLLLPLSLHSISFLPPSLSFLPFSLSPCLSFLPFSLSPCLSFLPASPLLPPPPSSSIHSISLLHPLSLPPPCSLLLSYFPSPSLLSPFFLYCSPFSFFLIR